MRATVSLLVCFVSNDRRIHSWCIGSCSGCHHSEPSAFRINLCIRPLDFFSNLISFSICSMCYSSYLRFSNSPKIFTIINATQLRFLKRLVSFEMNHRFSDNEIVQSLFDKHMIFNKLMDGSLTGLLYARNRFV